VCRRRYQSRRSSSSRGITGRLCDLEELLLLFGVFCKDGIEIDVFNITIVGFGVLDFFFFLPFFFLLLLLFCYLRLLALALSFFVFRHLVSMDCLGRYLCRRCARDWIRVFKVGSLRVRKMS